jgi:hypothetical protein
MWVRRLRCYDAPSRDEDLLIPTLTGLREENELDDESRELHVESLLPPAVLARWLALADSYGKYVRYQHLWFTFEMLRRVPRHWRRYAWWSASFDGEWTTEQRIAEDYRRRRREAHGERFVELVHGVDVTPGSRFPRPNGTGDCRPSLRRATPTSEKSAHSHTAIARHRRGPGQQLERLTPPSPIPHNPRRPGAKRRPDA